MEGEQNTPAAEQHVQAAEVEVKEAAQVAPNAAMEDALKAIHATLEDIRKELKDSHQQAAAVAPAAEQHTQEAVEPVVAVPAEAKRYVRRNGRKVKR
ncbi:MAG TPA: hypothetical protein VNG51_16885 [Ktedonobacteraceae bacterium]|nr:hypothetical protein [Ktedonobacteraceae bacterium]